MGLFNKNEKNRISYLEKKLENAYSEIDSLKKQLDLVTKKYEENRKFIENNNIKDYKQVLNLISEKQEELMNLRIQESQYRLKIKELKKDYNTQGQPLDVHEIEVPKKKKINLNFVAESNTSSDGFYNFSEISSEENSQLINYITEAISHSTLASIYLINNTLIEYLNKNRYYIEQITIEKYKNSKNIYDYLSVGIAYKAKGAGFRKLAINYLEKFIKQATEKEWKNVTKVNFQLDKYYIYVMIAELYEKEAILDKALNYITTAQKFKPSDIYGFYHVGNILKKVDINKCIEYYRSELKNPENKEVKKNIEKELNDAIEKQKKNYQYKPRKRKSNINVEQEEVLSNAANHYLKYFR